MPILKYRCNTCGKEFPKIVTSPEKKPKKCFVCGADTVEEIGEAFTDNAGTFERFFCQSCDSCSEEHTCGIK